MITNNIMDNYIFQLKHLNLNDCSQSDLNFFKKNKHLYKYYNVNGNIIINFYGKKKSEYVELSNSSIQNIENGSSEFEWDENEAYFDMYDFKEKSPLICLYNALEVIKIWKVDIKKYFPNNSFEFLVSLQHDEFDTNVTFRFNTFRKNKFNKISEISKNIKTFVDQGYLVDFS